jgi:hypothetical protein
VLSEDTDEATLEQFLADGVTLESRYETMLAKLEGAETRVRRLGRDDVDDLVAEFADIGLRILGPTQTQLELCADEIAEAIDANFAVVSDMLGAVDAPGEADAYRRLTSGGLDALDAEKRPGPAINLQSIVTRFEHDGAKVLFAGDMQFADPQVGGSGLAEQVHQLRGRIADDAPFDLVKLSHHGSDNAFSAEVLQELGNTRAFGICAGESSTHHPNPAVLRLLDQNRGRLRWVRTDHNGLSTVSFPGGHARLRPTTGRVSDPRPNVPDVREPEPVVAPAAEVVREGRGGEEVEVLTRVPHTKTKVRVTIEVEPSGSGALVAPRRRERTRARSQAAAGSPSCSSSRAGTAWRRASAPPRPSVCCAASKRGTSSSTPIFRVRRSSPARRGRSCASSFVATAT